MAALPLPALQALEACPGEGGGPARKLEACAPNSECCRHPPTLQVLIMYRSTWSAQVAADNTDTCTVVLHTTGVHYHQSIPGQ